MILNGEGSTTLTVLLFVLQQDRLPNMKKETHNEFHQNVCDEIVLSFSDKC